jgi:hypothetical protein
VLVLFNSADEVLLSRLRIYRYLVIVVFRKTLMLLTRNVIDPGCSSTLVADFQTDLKTPASPVLVPFPSEITLPMLWRGHFPNLLLC